MRSDFKFTNQHLIEIKKHPHLLGLIAGKSKLTSLHSEWIKYLWDGPQDEFRALQAHRGSYKTTAMAVGIVRWMLFHPDDRIAVIRKTFTDAAEVVDIISQMMDLPEIKALFKFAQGHVPRTQVRRYGKLRYNFKYHITPEGNVNAHGLDGSIVGKHYDVIWMDDFITLRDRISTADRDKTKELLREIITNIIDPGKRVIFTGTPWHRDDAWNIVPAEMRKYNVEQCGILSEKEVEQKKKTTTPFLYALNYDLKITVDEGCLFADPNRIRNWDFLERNVYAQLDAAYDGDNHCALTIMSRKKNTDTFQAVGWVYEGNVKDWIPEVVKKCNQYRAKKIYVENNADKGYTADKLKEYGLSVGPYDESMNKHIKISTLLYEVWDKILWIEETEDGYLNQIIDYREGQEPDDAPDSASSLVRQAFKKAVSNAMAMYQW